MSAIEQIDKIIEYDRRIRGAEVSGPSHASYILESPERAEEKIKELNELRKLVAVDDLDRSYKEKFFQSIDNSLSYFKERKKETIPDSLLLVGMGIFLGAAGMSLFEDAMKLFGEDMSKTFERKVYEKIEGMGDSQKGFKAFPDNYLSGGYHGKE